VSYGFLGLLLLVTFALLFALHATARMIIELFIPLIAAGAVYIEELIGKLCRKNWAKAAVAACLLLIGAINISFSLPVIPWDNLAAAIRPFRSLYEPLREFRNSRNDPPIFLSGRVGWDDLVSEVADVYMTRFRTRTRRWPESMRLRT